MVNELYIKYSAIEIEKKSILFLINEPNKIAIRLINSI